MEKITQEDLNTIRGQIRYYSALGKMESIIQKILVADEWQRSQALQFEKDRQAVLDERDRVKAECERSFTELQLELDQKRADFDNAAAVARKLLDEELAAKKSEIESLSKTAQQLADKVEKLRTGEAALQQEVDRLAATRNDHQAQLDALFARLRASAGRE